MITRNEFIKQYMGTRKYAGKDPETAYLDQLYLSDRPRLAIPCNCGYEKCEGWQMGFATDVEEYLNLTLGDTP